MSLRVLIMGLPGSGKTTLSHALVEQLASSSIFAEWFNADDVRKTFGDWDFSHAGRIRQARRMKEFADSSTADVVICDFIAPLPEMREIFGADITVWLDTIPAGRFEDTNSIFEAPNLFDLCITEKDAQKWAIHIREYIVKNR